MCDKECTVPVRHKWRTNHTIDLTESVIICITLLSLGEHGSIVGIILPMENHVSPVYINYELEMA